MRLHIGVLFFGLGLIIVKPLFSQTFVPGDLLVKTAQPWQSQANRLQSRSASPNINLDIKSIETLVTRQGKKSQLSSQNKRSATTEAPIYIYNLKLDPTANIPDIAKSLKGQILAGNEILMAQPNYLYKLSYATKDAPGYATYQRSPLSLIGMEEAWEFSVGSENVVIAVIDSGIDTDHPEFVGQLWQNPGETAGDGIDNDGNGFIDDVIGYNFVSNTATPEDTLGHGTHVSGTIAAKGTYITGVCPGCRIMSIKAANAAGLLEDSAVIESLDYAIHNGADIINMSFGGYSVDNDTQSISQSLISEGHNNGILFVAALGNDKRNVDKFLLYPAKYTHVLGISSVGNTGSRSGFSNFGSYNFIAAPGGQNLSPATYIYSTSTDNEYEGSYGTSMATPHVAGAIGLMKSVMPWLTPDEIHTALQLSAEDAGASGHDIYYGYGILDVPNAIHYADTIPASVFDLDTPPTVSAGADATVAVSATDNMRIENVRLYYRYYLNSIPISDWTYILMTELGSNRYSEDIPPGPAAATAIHTYVAAYDLHPSNPTYLPTGGASNPRIISYPDDIAGPSISFVAESGDFVDTQTELWVTDNHRVAMESIIVTVNTGVDEGQFGIPGDALSYDAGRLTLYLTETDLVLPEEGTIQISVQAADTSGNITTQNRSFSRKQTFQVVDGDFRTDSFLTYPNPFNPQKETCVFSYNLSKDAQIRIVIYSLAMKEVQKLVLPDSDGLAGYHEYSWDGRDYSGNILPNGVYLAIMSVESNGEKKLLKRHLAIKR